MSTLRRQLELPGTRARRRRRRRRTDRVEHVARVPFKKRMPVHVTVRMRPGTYNLRSKRCFRPIRKAFAAARERFECRLIEYAVLGDHLHLIIEADTNVALSRAMQGLGIRVAKALNKVMEKRGAVLNDRYHVVILRTPTQVRHAVGYVLGNFRKHAREWGEHLAATYLDAFSSACADIDGRPPPVVLALTWPLRVLRSRAQAVA